MTDQLRLPLQQSGAVQIGRKQRKIHTDTDVAYCCQLGLIFWLYIVYEIVGKEGFGETIIH
jgi:hypothetical protein